jgi:hypothetical protein
VPWYRPWYQARLAPIRGPGAAGGNPVAQNLSQARRIHADGIRPDCGASFNSAARPQGTQGSAWVGGVRAGCPAALLGCLDGSSSPAYPGARSRTGGEALTGAYSIRRPDHGYPKNPGKTKGRPKWPRQHVT